MGYMYFSALEESRTATLIRRLLATAVAAGLTRVRDSGISGRNSIQFMRSVA